MTFHAITSTKNAGWRRWLECGKCGIYVSTDQLGEHMFVDKSAPPKNALARNEVLADAGSAADRFGQDYLRDMPNMQPVGHRSKSP